MKKLSILLTVAVVIFVFAGCAVNTKLVERERVDQELTSGNQGYLMGTPPPAAERKKTREYFEVQVEVPSIERESRVPKKAPETQVVTEEEEYGVAEPAAKETYTTYTVQKGDTLQKISTKFFGTSKKWRKIFQANKEMLKSPDKIRPGQVIRIPGGESLQPKESEYIK